jgi:hypothetical protein
MDQKTLQALGFSAGIVTAVIIASAAFLAYKNYFEVVKLKLEISELRKEVAQS